MAAFDEIKQVKEQILAILEEQIVDAIRHKNATSASSERQQIDKQIHELMNRRDALLRWVVTAEEGSVELDLALQGLQSAAEQMNEAAAKMKATTEFLNNAADLLNGADAAIGALRQVGAQQGD
jgi:hypothetical protein